MEAEAFYGMELGEVEGSSKPDLWWGDSRVWKFKLRCQASRLVASWVFSA
jgi:hypothetical protein